MTGGGRTGTVVLPFGRYFAGRVDLLTREGFKTTAPITGVSPLSAVGEPDPELADFAGTDRVNDRVRAEVHKDLSARMAAAGADLLLIDNSTILMQHRQVSGRFYTVVPDEPTDLMDTLWNADPEEARSLSVRPSDLGFEGAVRTAYDQFVQACLEVFGPERILLVRSPTGRFWVDEKGTVSGTDINRSSAAFLAEVDDHLAERTGCRVLEAPQAHVPSASAWHHKDARLRRAIEDEVVLLCGPQAPSRRGPAQVAAARADSVADQVLTSHRSGSDLEWDELDASLAAHPATVDDLLALAHLDQRPDLSPDERVRLSACVRAAVAHPDSEPVRTTRERFERSLLALRDWPWSPLHLADEPWNPSRVLHGLRGWRWGAMSANQHAWRGYAGPGAGLEVALHGWRRASLGSGLWQPQAALPGAHVVLRFHADGTIASVPLEPVTIDDVPALVAEEVPVTPTNLVNVLSSWAYYLERGRRGTTSAPVVRVRDVATLIDTCAWLDWRQVLAEERVVLASSHPASVPSRRPDARTDLSFVFDPNTRVCSVGGGLMDQVTHVALFDSICRPLGLDYVLDDLRYIWWPSHNGFEASRLAPDLERLRLTRRVSPSLVEAFKVEVTRTHLPWIYNQSRTWFDLGLTEATVVTRDYFNARRLLATDPVFPVVLYSAYGHVRRLMEHPPSPVCFFTTQQRIGVREESSNALRSLFSYRHLEEAGLPPQVAKTAERIRRRPHVAFHVRRGDYLHPLNDRGGWFSKQAHYAAAIDFLIAEEFGGSDFDVAVFSDDLDFVESHLADYGLDQVTGHIEFVRGNSHYDSIFDSYLMSLCPVIVGSVGFFAATTSLLAEAPSTFIRSEPDALEVNWRREAPGVDARPS